MVLTRDDFMNTIKDVIGENTDDKSIKLLEDAADTLKDYEDKIATGDGGWKDKYEENDKMWRERYTQRFFSPAPDNKSVDTDEPTGQDIDTPDEPELKTKFEELFTTT